MILKLLIWQAGNTCKGYKAMIGHEAATTLSIQVGSGIWIYRNEHGVFLKPIYPNTEQETPKDNLQLLLKKAVNGKSLEANSADAGRLIMTDNIIPDDNGVGTYIFELQPTSKSDVFRLLYQAKAEKRGFNVDKNLIDNFKPKVKTKERKKSKIEDRNDFVASEMRGGSKDHNIEDDRFNQGLKKALNTLPLKKGKTKEVISEVDSSDEKTLLCDIVNKRNEKPPLGILPKFIVTSRRLIDIKEAMIRRMEVDCNIPIEWIVEYNELIKK